MLNKMQIKSLISFSFYINQIPLVWTKSTVYTEVGERIYSGCNLCKSTPQKEQHGVEVPLLAEDSRKDLKSEGYSGIVNKMLGANFLVRL